jgi:predicted DNA-binding transcriptional regulator YafY
MARMNHIAPVKRPRGRPRCLSPADQVECGRLAATDSSVTITALAKRFGVSRRTVGVYRDRWLKNAQAKAEHTGKAHKGHAIQEAAASAIREVSGQQCKRVLLALRAAPGGLTQEELSVRLSMQRASICARCAELREAGLARDTDTTRKTSSGRSASVWVAE